MHQSARKSRIPIPLPEIEDFCRRWKIVEFSLFGSVLRDDFRPDSDVDVMVKFIPDDPWSLFDVAQMKLELEKIFSRPVDLVEEGSMRNPFRRRSILAGQQVSYSA